MKNIAEKIGDQYNTWQTGERVFITAPTGSGKTYFCFHVLLPYAIQNHQSILYLVNRKALKLQLEEEKRRIVSEMAAKGILGVEWAISILTYQSLEEAVKSGNSLINKYYYRWIICDEAHYFLKDSLFNSATWLSYVDIMQKSSMATVIFMSATMERFIGWVKKDACKWDPMNEGDRALRGKKDHDYSLEKDYRYLDIHTFRRRDDIPDIIAGDPNKKWLIFYNNIEDGKQMCAELKRKGLDAIFVDAAYEENEGSLETVQYIAEKGQLNHRILIATSALDNGISIQDRELRNLIILADTEEDFVQMLGRKRKDGQKVVLYICYQNKNIFRQRERYLERVNQTRIVYEEMRYRSVLQQGISAWHNAIFLRSILDEAFKNPDFLLNCRKFLTVVNWNINQVCPIVENIFSNLEMNYRIGFYQKQIERIEKEGDDAFLKTQLEWLGLNEADTQEVVIKGSEEEKNKLQASVQKTLDEYMGKELNKGEALELKEKIKDDLRRLLSGNPNVERIVQYLGQNERVISEDDFKTIMEILNMKYRMIKKGRSKYYIEKSKD